MPPKFDSLLYPNAQMNTMRRAMKAAGVSNVPTNREGRRRLNRELVKLGAPELQVGVKASKEEPQRVFVKPEVLVPLSIEDNARRVAQGERYRRVFEEVHPEASSTVMIKSRAHGKSTVLFAKALEEERIRGVMADTALIDEVLPRKPLAKAPLSYLEERETITPADLELDLD
jgi:hypothetical protein